MSPDVDAAAIPELVAAATAALAAAVAALNIKQTSFRFWLILCVYYVTCKYSSKIVVNKACIDCSE